MSTSMDFQTPVSNTTRSQDGWLVSAMLNAAEQKRIRLGREQFHSIQKLENYDLSFLTRNFVDTGKEAPEEPSEQVFLIRAYFGSADTRLAARVEREFKKWVALCALEPEMSFVPSRPVDMYWHYFVLHTAEYRSFCQNVFGYFVEHVGAADEPTEEIQAARYHTIDLYERIFGPLDPLIWAPHLNPGCKNYSFVKGGNS